MVFEEYKRIPALEERALALKKESEEINGENFILNSEILQQELKVIQESIRKFQHNTKKEAIGSLLVIGKSGGGSQKNWWFISVISFSLYFILLASHCHWNTFLIVIRDVGRKIYGIRFPHGSTLHEPTNSQLILFIHRSCVTINQIIVRP